MGNQWVTSLTPQGTIGGPRNHDLLYWTILQFNSTGGIQQIEYSDTTQLIVP